MQEIQGHQSHYDVLYTELNNAERNKIELSVKAVCFPFRTAKEQLQIGFKSLHS